jgi:uncharacterized protein (TIGR00290 family)
VSGKPQLQPQPSAVALSWSGGKDSALALWEMRRRGWGVRTLLTTVTQTFGRVSMHEELLHAQAASVGLPVYKVGIPFPCPNELYRERMGRAVAALLAEGVDAFAFGDLFLEDIRAFREAQLAPTGKPIHFPLWGRNTAALAQEFLAAGFRAHVVAVDPRRLDPSFVGVPYDAAFLERLPTDVDPCGERGEFHTFVYAGPIFSRPVAVEVGEVVERDGFWFADLRPSAP